MQKDHFVGGDGGGVRGHPVYEFRLLPNMILGEVLRYADGAWLPDDGEYDLAFIGASDPFCWYIEHGHQKNIVFGWYSTHWSAREPRHPDMNAWHYALAEGEKDWGGGWGQENHENARIARKGMDKVCSTRGCANGRGIRLVNPDPHIAAGLVRNRDTKEVFTYPKNPICMYCGDAYKGVTA